MNYREIKLNNWKEFINFIDRLTENWCYRGQSNASWDLKTSLERTDFFRMYSYIEISFLHDYKRGARNYLTEKEIPENLLEWLALMQHHGAPTRLLDFTKSSYIASYFAFENAEINDDYVAIWCLNYRILMDKVEVFLNLKHDDNYEKERSKFSDEDFVNTKRHFTENDFERLFFMNDRSLILPIEPFKMNRRYSLQQSIFISTGNSNQTFMEQLEFLDEDLSKILIKITLPSKLKNEILRELQKMNINRASIFPDLDGYSNSLKMKYNSISTIYDLIKKHQDLIKDGQFEYYP